MLTNTQLTEAKRHLARENQKKAWQKQIAGKSPEEVSAMMKKRRKDRKVYPKWGKKLSTGPAN